ncbi:MAG: hypothetical protein ACXVA9_00605 [Bdellovibrionales bacterium]
MIRFVLAIALVFSFSAIAEESEVKLKMDELKEKNKMPGEDVDDIITNNLLRAESGSKSRWSVASVINYNGSSVEHPFAESRPNIAATTATTPEALLGGQVSLKYNLSTKSSWMAGVGVRWFSPLAEHRQHKGARSDMDNPYLIYQHVYKWAGVESVLQVQPVYYTNSNLKDHGYVSTVLMNQDNMYALGNSKFSAGISMWAQGGYFNKAGPSSELPTDENYMQDVRDDQADYLFGVAPVLEYAINDKFNLRTVTNLYNFEHLRSVANGNTYTADTITQSFGIGIAVTRDIFVYPNVQFLPENIRADKTNVAINTNINIF